MVNISTVVCQRLFVNGDLACSLGQEHLSLATLSLGKTIIFINELILPFYPLKTVLGLFKGEKLELYFRVDDLILHIVLVNLLAILAVNAKEL